MAHKWILDSYENTILYFKFPNLRDGLLNLQPVKPNFIMILECCLDIESSDGFGNSQNLFSDKFCPHFSWKKHKAIC